MATSTCFVAKPLFVSPLLPKRNSCLYTCLRNTLPHPSANNQITAAAHVCAAQVYQQRRAPYLGRFPSSSIMCDWEEFQFVCGHTAERLLSHCHFARTDPYHQCYGVKVIKNAWVQRVACQSCIDAIATRAAHEQQASKGHR